MQCSSFGTDLKGSATRHARKAHGAHGCNMYSLAFLWVNISQLLCFPLQNPHCQQELNCKIIYCTFRRVIYLASFLLANAVCFFWVIPMEYDISMQNVRGTLFSYQNDLWVSLFFLLFRLNLWWKIFFLWWSLITFAVFCFYPLSNFILCFSLTYFTPGLCRLLWWWELDIYLLASFLAWFSSCLLASFIMSDLLYFLNHVLMFSPAWRQQFPLPGQSVPCSIGGMCSGHGTQPAGAIWLKGANLQLLRLSFCLAVCLCVFVLSTAINTAAVVKAGICVLASWPCSCNQQSVSKEKLNFQNVHLQTAIKLPSWPNIPPWKPQKAVEQW